MEQKVIFISYAEGNKEILSAAENILKEVRNGMVLSKAIYVSKKGMFPAINIVINARVAETANLINKLYSQLNGPEVFRVTDLFSKHPHSIGFAAYFDEKPDVVASKWLNTKKASMFPKFIEVEVSDLDNGCEVRGCFKTNSSCEALGFKRLITEIAEEISEHNVLEFSENTTEFVYCVN